MSGAYDAMTMSELFVAWTENWMALSTGIQQILGDEPMPDPREIAHLMKEMPEHVWHDLFKNEHARAELKKTMDLQKVMAQIQAENVAILDSALNREPSIEGES